MNNKAIAAGIALLLIACLAAGEPRIYSDGNQSGMLWINAVRLNGSLTMAQLITTPADGSSSNVINGYTAGAATWTFKDLFSAGGFGAISAVQTSNSGLYLSGGANEGTADLILNESKLNDTITRVDMPLVVNKTYAISTYLNYSSCTANNIWQYTSGCTATDGTGDCAASAVCTGGHTHSQYITSAVTQIICGTGLTGGTITTSGTCAADPSILANTTWTASTYFPLGGKPNINGANITAGTIGIPYMPSGWLNKTYADTLYQASGSYITSTAPQDNNITNLWTNASNQDTRIISLETRPTKPNIDTANLTTAGGAIPVTVAVANNVTQAAGYTHQWGANCICTNSTGAMLLLTPCNNALCKG